jgi:surface antigen
MPLHPFKHALRQRGVKPTLCRAVGFALAVSASVAAAANFFFSQEMPIAHMTPEDIDILQTALFETLDNAPDGEMHHWENPKTQAHGDLTPRSTFADAGLRCRMVEIENSAGGRNNRSMLTLCKSAEGWKVRSY